MGRIYFQFEHYYNLSEEQRRVLREENPKKPNELEYNYKIRLDRVAKKAKIIVNIGVKKKFIFQDDHEGGGDIPR